MFRRKNKSETQVEIVFWAPVVEALIEAEVDKYEWTKLPVIGSETVEAVIGGSLVSSTPGRVVVGNRVYNAPRSFHNKVLSVYLSKTAGKQQRKEQKVIDALRRDDGD